VPLSTLILTPDQRAQVDQLADSLDREQAIWLSGYFAGVARSGAAPADLAVADGAAPAVAGPATRTLTVLYGTDTGNSREVAGQLAEAAQGIGVTATVADMADYKTRLLKDEQDLLVVIATHGEGDPPPAAVGFFEFLQGRKAPKLPDLRFSVLALGDSTYEHYCSAGKQVDERLEQLGATRVADRVDCDVDYEDDAAAWVSAAVAGIAPTEAPVAAAPAAVSPNGAVAATGAHSKKNPFTAAIVDNVVITGRGSTKETRHVEISLEDSGLTYEPGDALGIVPRNEPALVEALLDKLSLAAEAEVPTKQGPAPLVDALTATFEITAATPRFLEHWAELSGAAELEALRAGDAKARTAYFHEHHIRDIVERFPVPGLTAEQFVAGLRPLQSRLYSIASSLNAAPDEAHLTVSTVQYALHGIDRTGVASGHLARLTDEDATVPVYVQANEHFRLPADDVPIIMVGAGTGVAPYRAFMQEREVRGAEGRSWLFFGERNFRSDFLYQVEWQQLLKDGTLTRLDLAFSRDESPKTYVQDRLRRAGRDVWDWLQDGARIYVCGDATHMAPDVDATLAAIAGEHGGLDADGAHEYLSTLKSDHRYLLDVY
jgi:sulfite reductase (NADPH) flavoprotein alpha-component